MTMNKSKKIGTRDYCKILHWAYPNKICWKGDPQTMYGSEAVVDDNCHFAKLDWILYHNIFWEYIVENRMHKSKSS